MTWQIQDYSSANKEIKINVSGVTVLVDYDDVDRDEAERVAAAISKLVLGVAGAFIIVCEWDIGQEGLVFSTWEAAQEWAVVALEMQFKDETEEDYDWATLNGGGLIMIDELSIQ